MPMRSIRSLVTTVTLLFICLANLPAHATTWRSDLVDTGSSNGLDIGKGNDMALDSADNRHISYFDATTSALMYATDASGDWVTSQVAVEADGSSGSSGSVLGTYASSIAVDSSDKIHIAYCDTGSSSSYRGPYYATNASGSWVSTRVNNDSCTGDVSLALNGSGNVYIAYGQANYVRLATNLAGSWSAAGTSISTSYSVSQIALAIDSADNPHLVYNSLNVSSSGSAGYGSLYYQYATNTTTTSTTDAYGAVTTNPSYTWSSAALIENNSMLPDLALDSADAPHVTYYAYSSSGPDYLKYATGASSTSTTTTTDSYGHSSTTTSTSWSWTAYEIESLSSREIVSSALLLDSSDAPHVIYQDDGELYHAHTPAASSSTTTTTDPYSGATSSSTTYSYSMTSESLGHFLYYGNPSPSDPLYSRFLSAALDASDAVSVAFYDARTHDLRVLESDSGWNAEVVVDDAYGVSTSSTSSGSDTGTYASQAVAGDEYVVSFYDAYNRRLNHATRSTTRGWPSNTDISYTSAGVGQFTSIVVDADNATHTSYYDQTAKDLKYTSSGTTTVDSAGNVGLFTSIGADSNGAAHISYYDATNQDLKYATNASGSWVTSTIDSAGNSGQYTSLAVDSSDFVHIAYFGQRGLKYATNASGAWAIKNVDTPRAGNSGKYAAIALDSAGKVHISYYSENTSALRYATNASGAWVKTTVDNSADVGQYTSIAIDASDKAHISYYDVSNSNLMYATNESGAWATEVLDDDNVGKYTDIVIAGDDTISVIYYDATGKELRRVFR